MILKICPFFILIGIVGTLLIKEYSEKGNDTDLEFVVGIFFIVSSMIVSVVGMLSVLIGG